MNILLLGADGQLGIALQTASHGHHVLAMNHDDIDLATVTVAGLLSLLQQQHIDVLINAAAYTAVDKAETDVAAAYAVNADAVAILAQACGKAGVRLVHVSTDYVFDGRAETPYGTQAKTSPVNVYGASKALGEALLFQYLPQAVCLRTAWLYSAHGTNFVKTMLRLLREGQPVSVVHDQLGSPTWAPDVAEVIWRIVGKPEVQGLWHWTSSGQCSWFEFAQAIQQRALAKGLLLQPCEIRPIAASAYVTAAQRPAYSVLDCQASVQLLQVPQRPWTQALDEMLDLLLL